MSANSSIKFVKYGKIFIGIEHKMYIIYLYSQFELQIEKWHHVVCLVEMQMTFVAVFILSCIFLRMPFTLPWCLFLLQWTEPDAWRSSFLYVTYIYSTDTSAIHGVTRLRANYLTGPYYYYEFDACSASAADSENFLFGFPLNFYRIVPSFIT